MTEQTNTPELRFPEFKDSWHIKNLKEIGTFKNGINKDKNSFGYGFPFVNLNDVFSQSNISINDLGLIDSTQKERAEYNLIKGDILFIRSSVKPSGVGLTKVVHQSLTNTVYSGFLIRFREQSKVLDDNFKSYIFSSKTIRKQIIALSSTSANTNINQDSLKKVKVILPILKEQKKIGNFFSKLDQQIELEEQKLAKLEEQKKGYMQKIFSQELRFRDKDGNCYPEWKEYVLGEIGNTYGGLASKTKEDFGYGDSYFITYMNVFKYTIAKANMIEKVNIQENEKQNKVNYKDILFTTSSEVPEETGMSSIWLYKENNVYLNSFCFGFRVNCDDIEPIYLTRFLRSEKMRKQITILSQGSTRFNISKKEVMKLKIDVPNLEEQTKIVDFLSQYDSLVENQSSKIALLKERKQGFLQKMFV